MSVSQYLPRSGLTGYRPVAGSRPGTRGAGYDIAGDV